MDAIPFYAQAEYYSHRDIERFTFRHPEAPTVVDGNMLLLGTAGTGKSMVMRQLVAEYENSDRIYPLYIHAEEWLSETLAEHARRNEYETSRFDGIRIKCVILFALAIIERLISLDQCRVAAAASEWFPERPDDDSELTLREWLNDTWIDVKSLPSQSKKWREEYASFTSLPDVLNYIGRQTLRILGRRLALFVDQLDRVGPAYFEVLGSAFVRSTSYTICLASRPSVCAPEATTFDARVGNNRQVWLGAGWDNDDWSRFLVDAATSLFDNETISVLRRHRRELAALVGPSTRQFMEIARRLKDLLRGTLDQETALDKAVRTETADYQGRLASCLVGVDTFSGLVQELNTRLVKDDNDVTARLTRIDISASDGLILSDETIARIRVLVREGFLVPHDAARYGVDNVGNEYHVIPQGVCSPAEDWALVVSDRRCSISETDFMSWSVPTFKRRKVVEETGVEPSIFYSHWMSDTNLISSSFLKELAERLAPDAYVTTGKTEFAHPHLRKQVALRSNQNIADHIRKNIEIATAVVVQLDNPRPAIGVELGWALSFGRPVVLAYGSSQGFAEIPDWLKIDELHENGTEQGREALVSLLEEQIVGWSARKAPLYMREGDGTATIGSYQRELHGSLIVGSGDRFMDLAHRAGDRAAYDGLERPSIIDTSISGRGRIVSTIAAKARRASTLLAVHSGDRDQDILTWLALGAFSFRDTDTIRHIPGVAGQRSLRRQFVVYSESDWGLNSEPSSMMRGLSGYSRSLSVDEAIDQYHQNLRALSERIRPDADR
ncbi:hypothetical protein GCM10027058_29520 [Microbacterium neimengense]